MHTYLLYNIYEHAEVVRNEPEDPLLLTTDTPTHTHTHERKAKARGSFD
jgi:Tat protein secretion system quality control protein TatD with DNase activity